MSANRTEPDAARGPRVILLGFGGPESQEEIRPFVKSVLAGRPVPPGRVEEVASHYELLGGRSPYNDRARALAASLADRLAVLGRPLPVRLALRHAAPALSDVLSSEVAESTPRLVALTMTPHAGREAGGRYRSDLEQAFAKISGPQPAIDWCAPYYIAEGFVAAWAERVRAAAGKLGGDAAANPLHLLFTAHSVPLPAAEPYRSQVEATARRVAEACGWSPNRVSLAWQSRSGSPEDPWLEPDVCDEIRHLSSGGAGAVLVAPIGFICDHVEVLYDLGVEAREAARSEGMRFGLVPTVDTHPSFVDALARIVIAQADRAGPAGPAGQVEAGP